MTTIAEFLEARWTELEDAAKALNGEAWIHTPEHSVTIKDANGNSVMYDEGQPAAQDHHIVLHDPEFELKVTAANRRILAVHAVQGSLVSDYTDCSACMDVDTYDAYPCRTVRLLALPFDQHPDYDETWKPAG